MSFNLRPLTHDAVVAPLVAHSRGNAAPLTRLLPMCLDEAHRNQARAVGNAALGMPDFLVRTAKKSSCLAKFFPASSARRIRNSPLSSYAPKEKPRAAAGLSQVVPPDPGGVKG